MGFSTPQYYIKSSSYLTVENLSKLFLNRRKNSPYELDGIVVKHNKEYKNVKETIKHGFAFKDFFDGDKAEVTVNHVEWNISKDGKMKPRV